MCLLSDVPCRFSWDFSDDKALYDRIGTTEGIYCEVSGP